MMPTRLTSPLHLLRSLALGCAVALALAIALGGCGGGDEETASGETSGSSPEYVALLEGLQSAAASNSTTYDAVQRAEALPAAEKAVIEAFCFTAWEIGINQEAERLKKYAYIVNRLTVAAQLKRERGEVDLNRPPPDIEAAVDELDSVVGLKSLNGADVASYSKACEKTPRG
jgi:hypothetical protein